MGWQGVAVLHGALHIPGVHGDGDLREIQRRARDYAQRLAARMEKLL